MSLTSCRHLCNSRRFSLCRYMSVSLCRCVVVVSFVVLFVSLISLCLLRRYVLLYGLQTYNDIYDRHSTTQTTHIDTQQQKESSLRVLLRGCWGLFYMSLISLASLCRYLSLFGLFVSCLVICRSFIVSFMSLAS